MNVSSPNDVRRSQGLLIAGFAIIAIFAAAVLIRWPDHFFADDSYFYFQVAWNIARGMGSTFNNVIPTNGYHPLWMLVCVAVFKVFPAKLVAIRGIAGVISLLDMAALVVLYRLLARVAPYMWWAAFSLFLPFCFLSQLGTEGALSGFVLAALALVAYQLALNPTAVTGSAYVVLGALAVLSRLDNIFIVGLTFVAMFFWSPEPLRPMIRRIMLVRIPIYVLLWGGYVFSNEYWFHTIQPISGMLKAHPHGEVIHYGPPHVEILALLVIVPCILILARFRRDTFFKVFEAPCAAGVFIHFCYITFVMSSETRWTWYYTSWMLLASITLSRVFSLALEKRSRSISTALATIALAGLALVFVRSYRGSTYKTPAVIQADLQPMIDKARAHTVIAFDKPGGVAYYTDWQVVALDGLMGDLKFQQDLAAHGIAAFDAEHHVDSFLGPPQPMDAFSKAQFCDSVDLSTVRFHCVSNGQGLWNVDSVEVFARLSGQSAGVLAIPAERMVWNQAGQLAIWRLR